MLDINTIAVIAAGFVILFIILRMITKVAFKFVGAIFIMGLIVIGLLVGTGNLDLNKFEVNAGDFKFMDLEEQYCATALNNNKTCELIIQPLLDKIQSKYTDSEIARLKENKIRWITVIYETLNQYKGEIQRNLHQHNADQLWDAFIEDLVSMNLDPKFNEAFNKMKAAKDSTSK